MSRHSVRDFVNTIALNASIPVPEGSPGTFRQLQVWDYVPTGQAMGDDFFCILSMTQIAKRVTLSTGGFIQRDHMIECQLTVIDIDEAVATNTLDANLQGFEYAVRAYCSTQHALVDNTSNPPEDSTIVTVGGWLYQEGSAGVINVSTNDILNDLEGLNEGDKMAISLVELKLTELVQLAG